jgi:hypothetical protein
MEKPIKLSAKDKSKYITAWNSQFREIIYSPEAMNDEEKELFKDDPEFIKLILEVKAKENEIMNYINQKVIDYRKYLNSLKVLEGKEAEKKLESLEKKEGV